MKRFFYGLLLLCPMANRAQERAQPRPMEWGAYMQEIKTTKLINSATAAFRISDYRDKLLIIDFWATWCGACIKGFPRLDSLQRKYRDKLQVLLVSSPGNDPPEKISRFFRERRNPSGQKLELPVVWGEPLFDQLFPHKVIPHSVWIYKGKFYAVTSPEDITEEKLDRLFSGRDPQLEKLPERLRFDPACSLQEQGWPLAVIRKDSISLLARYIPGAGVKIGKTPPSAGTVHRYYVNLPLVALVAQAWPAVPVNRILPLNGMEKELAAVHNTTWKKQHWYTYQLSLPAGLPGEEQLRLFRSALQKDVDIEVKLEKRWMEAFAIVRSARQPLLQPVVTITDTTFTRGLNGYWTMHNQPLSALVGRLNQQSPGMPLVPIILDETGDSRAYTMDFPFPDLQDLSCLKEVLLLHGLDIIPVKRELEVLVLRPAFIYQKSN